MSDLQARNAKAMIERLKALDKKMGTQEQAIVLQNAKITGLSQEVTKLQNQIIVMITQGRGSGPTVQ